MDTGSITDFITEHIPELILLIGGIIALFLVYTYVKDKDSRKYKVMMALGVLFGVLMIIMSITSHEKWDTFVLIVIAITGFTLAIRPFREVHFAAIGALLIMVMAYIFIGDLAGTSLDFLVDRWPRIIAAFIIGALAYMIMNFAESIIKLFGKLLNWWPFLAVLALICIIESILMFSGYGSLYDFITGGQ